MLLALETQRRNRSRAAHGGVRRWRVSPARC